MDYKETLNLPRTGFPMRANLPVKEKEILGAQLLTMHNLRGKRNIQRHFKRTGRCPLIYIA